MILRSSQILTFALYKQTGFGATICHSSGSTPLCLLSLLCRRAFDPDLLLSCFNCLLSSERAKFAKATYRWPKIRSWRSLAPLREVPSAYYIVFQSEGWRAVGTYSRCWTCWAPRVRIISATLMNIFLHTPSFFCLLKKATCDASILRFAYASEARQAVPFSFSIQQSWVDKECPTFSSAWFQLVPLPPNLLHRLQSQGALPDFFTLSWLLNSSERSYLYIICIFSFIYIYV